jgi:hypothetical protein
LMPEVIRHLAISLEKEGLTPETIKRVDPFKEQPLPVRPTAPIPAPRTRTRTVTPVEKPKASEKDEATRLKELEDKLGKLLEEE